MSNRPGLINIAKIKFGENFGVYHYYVAGKLHKFDVITPGSVVNMTVSDEVSEPDRAKFFGSLKSSPNK